MTNRILKHITLIWALAAATGTAAATDMPTSELPVEISVGGNPVTRLLRLQTHSTKNSRENQSRKHQYSVESIISWTCDQKYRNGPVPQAVLKWLAYSDPRTPIGTRVGVHAMPQLDGLGPTKLLAPSMVPETSVQHLIKLVSLILDVPDPYSILCLETSTTPDDPLTKVLLDELESRLLDVLSTDSPASLKTATLYHLIGPIRKNTLHDISKELSQDKENHPFLHRIVGPHGLWTLIINTFDQMELVPEADTSGSIDSYLLLDDDYGTWTGKEQASTTAENLAADLPAFYVQAALRTSKQARETIHTNLSNLTSSFVNSSATLDKIFYLLNNIRLKLTDYPLSLLKSFSAKTILYS